EVMLVPMYFLIGVWGSERRLYAAIKFFLYTLAGSVIMLLGILALYFNAAKATGVQTFDIPMLLAAGCAHGGAHSGLRHPGRRSAENGHVRFPAFLAAVAPHGYSPAREDHSY